MSDIAKRLLISFDLGSVYGGPDSQAVCARQMLEAANEIGRLRAELAARDAECARLREAMRILDGFVEPAPTAAQWSAVCAKARELKAELAKESKS